MKGKFALFTAVPVLLIGGYAYTRKGAETKPEIEFRYAAVTRGELVRSISATGQVVALTKVDVKSKAGGRIVRLAVDEGSIVRRGDLIAVIDPEDTRAIYEQADADLQGANARAIQAERNYELQVAQNRNDVENARAALDAAKARYRRAAIESRRQPTITQANIATAQANVDAALSDLERLQDVTIPQMRRDAQATLSNATTQRDTAVAEYERQEGLLAKGYVSGAAVDRARAAAETARSNYATTQQRTATVENEIRALLRSQQKAVERARAALQESRANSSQPDISRTNVAEAEKNVQLAEVALRRAIDNQVQNEVRRSEILAAKASTVRSKVSLRNARVQLDSTTVVAPRDGVVTMKYLEEGTIIPPGTSTFAQGTSLVQLSDVTQLYVECAVDEADIANVQPNQKVKITTEAFPGQSVDGVVTRVNPAAVTEQNITAVKVRVKVLPGAKIRLLPGMNATCEFITLSKPNTLIAPSQAVKMDGADKATVRVKSKDPLKPETRTVVVGETGNEGVEIKSGLKDGEEVVTAEIDVAALREVQKKMQEAQEGGGLAGGRPGGGGNRRPAAGGNRAGAGGGQRGR